MPDSITPVIPLKIGVYQGDPLSVVIFNTVINTLIDTLKTRLDLGYTYSESQHTTNLLQYADDTCLVANSPASCQHLLDMVDMWLKWSGMKAKVTKCNSMAIQGSTGKTINPNLKLSGENIPYAGNGPVRFLGMLLHIPHSTTHTKSTLISRLREMLERVDSCPVTRRQKCRIYKAAICPRLSWLLTIEELPITWVERQLEQLATRYVKKWAGLAKSASPALLYLPNNKGGLNLPPITSLYKRLQVSRQALLLTSPDACVRHAAEKHLQRDLTLTRKKFKPNVVVRDVLVQDPGQSRRALATTAKRSVKQADDDRRETELKNLERQGQMMRNASPNSSDIWAKSVMSIPSHQMKFALNAAVDTLPHNANLQLWKKESDACTLCGERQSLIHVLNGCKVALDLRRYNGRHDDVLRILADAVSKELPDTTNFTVDLDGNYNFPVHIIPTDERPDMVWWDDSKRTLCLAELTVCFETSFDNAVSRKTNKYCDLVTLAMQAGYKTMLITLEVGSRGIPNPPGFRTLQEELCMASKDLATLQVNASKAAIAGSHKIWCWRNTKLIQGNN